MDEAQRRDLAACAQTLPGLRLLLLIGSQATGAAHAGSDVDLGYLADAVFDVGAAHARLSTALGRDDVDLVDLARASALLRHRASDEGVLLWQDRPGRVDGFRHEAATYWVDAEWVIRHAQDAVLAAW